jgi:cobalt/nickel transport system permease protein
LNSTERDQSVKVPDWMKCNDTIKVSQIQNNIRKRKKRKNFIEKSISGVFNFFEESLQNEAFINKNGFMQKIDPRVKLLSVVFLIFGTCMTRSVTLLIALYILSLVIAYTSRINLLVFVKRIWFIPIFAGIIIFPVIFINYTPANAVLILMQPGPGAHIGPIQIPEIIAITSIGLLTAFRFILRVIVCVSFAILLFLTTRHSLLFKALRSFHIPKIYVLTLDMCYRYIFLLSGMIRDLYLAKKSRTIKPLSMRKEQKWVGERIGETLIKSIKTSEAVHMAMISRGFNGDVKMMHTFDIHKLDYMIGGISVFIGVSLIILSQISIMN